MLDMQLNVRRLEKECEKECVVKNSQWQTSFVAHGGFKAMRKSSKPSEIKNKLCWI